MMKTTTTTKYRISYLLPDEEHWYPHGLQYWTNLHLAQREIECLKDKHRAGTRFRIVGTITTTIEEATEYHSN